MASTSNTITNNGASSNNTSTNVNHGNIMANASNTKGSDHRWAKLENLKVIEICDRK